MASKFDEELAERLRLARIAAGLSQGQIAKMMELHRPTITEIEAGRRKVKSEELVQFARLYGTSVEWLTSSGGSDTSDSDSIRLAARKIENLKPKDLESVLELISIIERRSRE